MMDQGLKQRIVGALVLVVAAVVFLPMLLSGQDETVQVEVNVPPAPQLAEDELVAAIAQPLPVPEPVAEIPSPATAAPLPEPVEIAPPEPVVPVPAPVVQPAVQPPVSGGWVIQQASFSSEQNAESFRATLIKQGYNAYTRAGQSAGKPIVRVYVGPLASREAANQVRAELERRHKDKGQIVAYDENTRAR